jgi:cytochrome c oxidase assembly protein subunit 20
MMAGDIRDSDQPTPRGPLPGATAPPGHVKDPKIYEVFNGPPKSANALPEGSGLNTAGAHAEVPTLSEAVKTVRLQDFQQVHMYPCVRESLLNGIGGGFGIGGLRLLFGGRNYQSSDYVLASN